MKLVFFILTIGITNVCFSQQTKKLNKFELFLGGATVFNVQDGKLTSCPAMQLYLPKEKASINAVWDFQRQQFIISSTVQITNRRKKRKTITRYKKRKW